MDDASQVSKKWERIANEPFLLKKASREFANFKLAEIFGETKIEPLRDEIGGILKSACLFDSTKKVFQTHLLVYLPKDLTLRKILELGKKYFAETQKLNKSDKEMIAKLLKNFGESLEFREIVESWQQTNAKKRDELEKGGWMLITKIFTKSLKKQECDHQAMSELFVKQTTYDMPSLREGAACNFTACLSSDKGLFGINPDIYIRCKPIIGNGHKIGGFGPVGISSSDKFVGEDNIGIAAIRQL